MIPYWPQPVWTFGPLTIHAFGVAQAVALVAGYVIALSRARSAGLDERRTGRLFVVTVLVGLTSGYVVQHLLSGASWSQLGQSAAGMTAGAVGVVMAAWWWSGSTILPHIDTLASVAPLVNGIARFGCFLAHDHRGRPASGPFAVRFPEGARIDVGLVDCVIALAVAWPIWRLWRSRPQPGFVTAVTAVVAIAMRLVSSYLT